MLMAVSMLREPHGMWAVIMSAHVRTLPPTNTSVMPGQYLAVYMCTLQCRIIFIHVKEGQYSELYKCDPGSVHVFTL